MKINTNKYILLTTTNNKPIMNHQNKQDEDMKNADMPAMPQHVSINDLGDCETSDRAGGEGLTKREMFAMNFHAAILSRNGQISTKDLASKAAEHADALLAELDK